MIRHETSAACGVIKDKTSAEYRTMTHESSGTCRSMYNNVTCASITISYTTEREIMVRSYIPQYVHELKFADV